MIRSRAHVGASGRWLLHARSGVAAIAQTIVVRFLLAAINVVTGVITARVLSAGGRGEQSVMLLWPALICYLLTLGLPSAVRYCIRKEPERRSELFSVSVFAALTLSAVAFTVGFAFIPLWLHTYSPEVIRDAQLLMIFAPEVMLGLILTAMLETQGDFTKANSTRYIPAVITLIALAILAATHALTPFRSALAYLVPPVFTAAWLVWKLRGYFTRRAFDPRPALRTLGSYGLRSFGIDILATLSKQVDQVLVVGILSAEQMGVYAVALAASRVPQILHSAVVTVVLPKASGLDHDRVVMMVGRAARLSTVIAFVFGALLVPVLPFLIPSVYGSAFAHAATVAQVLTLEALIGGLVFVLSQSFMALGRPGLVTFLQGLGLSVAIPAMLILLPRLGLIGAALALLISTIARLAFLLLSFPMILKKPIPNLLPTTEDLRALIRALPKSVA
jgi:O-antigen/teichoic acid export membrane protein